MTTTSKKSIPPPARPVKPPEAGFNIPQANYPILENCYGQGWSGVVPETFLHPAKFSRALIRRIYDIALQRGWLRPGDWVLDPFGGVGLGAVDALFSGVNWVGVEIERRFVDIGAGCDCGGINKADWVRFYGRWGQASDRHWCPACLAQAGQVMDEYQPPLSHTQRARRARIVELAKKARRRINLVKPLPLPEIYKPIPKQGALFSRPDTGAAYVRGSYQIPTTDPHHYTGNLERFQRHARDGARAILLRGDSRKLGQVINQVAGVLGSPPYAGTNQNYRKGWQYIDRAKLPHSRSSRQQQADYGDEPGNVANLPDQGFDLTISSPVYGGNDKHDYTLDGRDQTGQGQGSFRGCSGHEPGQLAKLSNSDLDAVIGSPMFAGNSGGHGQASRNGIDPALFDRHSGGMIGGISSDPANIGSLPVSGFDAVIGSSPYMGSLDRGTVEAQGRAALARQKGLSNSEHISPIDMEQVGRRTQPDYGDAEGQLGSMIEGDLDAIISSSPYGQAQAGGVGIYDQLEQTHNRQFTEKSRRNGYRAEQQGDSEAQIANLSEGDLDAIIASSPYAGSVGSAEAAKRGGLYRDPRRAARDRNLNATYGHTPGQLGAMVEGIITSPVYGTGTVNDRNGIDPAYFDGQAEGQLGREAGETFWSAVRLILDQCFLALRPGGVSIWICKDFIRDGERIPFCDMWRRLCESLGFEHLETYLALQIKDRGTQTTIDGDMVNLTTEYKSFFRRNYEKKNPDQRIDWEAVICMRKPEAAIE